MEVTENGSERAAAEETPVHEDEEEPAVQEGEMESEGWRWWRSLGAPRLVLAPMVDASELAWRLLSRELGATLCYSPMLHAAVFARDPKYRRDALASCPQDRPLIVQLCGNCPETLVSAAVLAQDHCDAIDVNLGCPQAIARRGRYGAFLQDDWPLLADIVSSLRRALRVPVTCKIRVFAEVERTVSYARMLEAAGCQLLAVHGRTREQRGPLTGLASWPHIAAVVRAVRVPVIANGNVRCLADVRRCLRETRAAAVMSAEGQLRNPALFQGRSPPAWEPALRYLELAARHPCPPSVVRGHLFKLFQHCLCLEEHKDIRSRIATAGSLEEMVDAVQELRDRLLPLHEGLSPKPWEPPPETGYDLVLPPWICQPYVRDPPEVHLQKVAQNQTSGTTTESVEEDTTVGGDAEKENHDGVSQKRPRESSVESTCSKSLSKRLLKKMRKLQRNPNKVFHGRKGVEKCAECPNPMGTKCEHQLCKACCRTLCYTQDMDCPGHRILIKTRREKARHFAALQQQSQEDGCQPDEDTDNMVDKKDKQDRAGSLITAENQS